MKLSPIANRIDELKILRDILTNQIQENFFLIKANSDMCKSDLLKRFIYECKTNYEISNIVTIELNVSESGLPFLLNCVRQELGTKSFNQFSQCLNLIISNHVEVSRSANLFGTQQIEVALNIDKAMRGFQLMNLQQAFFSDLGNFTKTQEQKTVILIDGFESAIPELKNWIQSQLLRAALKIPKLVIVIAGKEVPNHEDNITWGGSCKFRELSNIKDESAWYKFVQESNLFLGVERRDILTIIRTLTFELKGNPQVMKEALYLHSKGWEKTL